jgi:hypothetical protein
MKKKRACKETVEAFMKAVYPNDTELCIAMSSEEEILKDATALILCYREEYDKRSKI